LIFSIDRRRLVFAGQLCFNYSQIKKKDQEVEEF